MELGDVHQLVPNLHFGVQAALLRHVADASAGLKVQRDPIKKDVPGGWFEHAQRDAHRGGLACAVRADETKDLGRAYGKTKVIERPQVAVVLAQTAYLEV